MGKFKKISKFRHPLFLNTTEKLDRKKVLRSCMKKLRHLYDAESKLHQAVLLNNTLQRIKDTKDIQTFNPEEKENEKKSTKMNNNIIKSHVHESTEAFEFNHDIFSELSLPPPLNTIQLEQFSFNNEAELRLDKLKDENKKNSKPVEEIQYQSVINYYLEDEDNLFQSIQSCFSITDNLIISSLKRTQ